MRSHRGIWLSSDGTLLDTSKRFVKRAPAGYSAQELDSALQVQTRQALLQLPNRQLIDREKIGGAFVYLALEAKQRQRQVIARGKIAKVAVGGGVSEEILSHEVQAAIILFFGLLDERQRRLFTRLGSMKTARGGNARIAAMLGMDPHTVAKGRIELLGEDIDPTLVRRPGGSLPMPRASRCPTESMMSAAMRAWSPSEHRVRPPLLPSTPSNNGGDAAAKSTTLMARNY